MLLRNIFEGGSSYKTLINSENKLVEVLRNGYSQYFANQSEYRVFRGASATGSAIGHITNPKVEGRTSAHTSNEYTLLMSNDPLWSAFPKRSESIICTTSTGGASSYGIVYAVIPPDSFKFGVVPAADLWDGFDTIDRIAGSYGMDTFNRQLRNIIFTIYSDEGPSIVKTYQGLRTALESITYKTIASVNFDSNSNKLYSYIESKLNSNRNSNAYDIIMQELLNPSKNGFWTLTSHSEFSKLPTGSSELWTDSTCVLINLDNIDIEFPELQKRVLQ